MVKHTQIIRRVLPTNCLSVFHCFVGLAVKGLNYMQQQDIFSKELAIFQMVRYYWFTCIKTTTKYSSKSIICRDMDIKASAQFLFSSFCYVRFISACSYTFTALLFWPLQITQTDGQFISSIAELQLKEIQFPVASFLSFKPLSLLLLYVFTGGWM